MSLRPSHSCALSLPLSSGCSQPFNPSLRPPLPRSLPPSLPGFKDSAPSCRRQKRQRRVPPFLASSLPRFLTFPALSLAPPLPPFRFFRCVLFGSQPTTVAGRRVERDDDEVEGAWGCAEVKVRQSFGQMDQWKMRRITASPIRLSSSRCTEQACADL